MGTKLFNLFPRQFSKNAELIVVVIFLFFTESINIPEQLIVIFNLINYVFVGFMVLRLWKKMAYVVTQDLSLIILVGFAVCSFLWSADIGHTLKNSAGLLRMTVFGIYLATCFSFQSHLRIFALLCGLVVAVNVFVYVAFPSFANQIDPNDYGKISFVGIYNHKQYAGRIMSLSLITLLMYFRVYSRHRWLSALGVLGAAFLLFLSHSYTYQIGAIIGVLLIPLHQITNLFNKHEFNLRTVLYLLIMTLSVVFVSFIFANWESIIIPTFGKGSTFNGRVPIWNLAIEQLMKRPLLGYGYSSFWSSYEGSWIYQKIPWAVTARRGDVTSWHAHNAFIDLALQLGLIGLAMLFVNIALVFYRAISLMNASQGLESLWMLQVLSIQLIASSSEAPTYLSGFSVYWVIYVAMAFSSATLLHKMHQSRRSFPMLLLVH